MYTHTHVCTHTHTQTHTHTHTCTHMYMCIYIYIYIYIYCIYSLQDPNGSFCSWQLLMIITCAMKVFTMENNGGVCILGASLIKNVSQLHSQLVEIDTIHTCTTIHGACDQLLGNSNTCALEQGTLKHPCICLHAGDCNSI